MNESFLRSFPWKHKSSVGYLDFSKYIFLYLQLAFMAIQMFVPYSWYTATTSIFALIVLLGPVILLLLYTKIHLNGKKDEDDETLELSRVVYMRMCIDCFLFVWIVYSYNGAMAIIADR